MSAPHNLFNTLQKFDLGNGKQGKILFAARAGKSRRRRDFKIAGFNPPCAGIRSAQLRRQKSFRGEHQGTRELEAERNAHGGNSVRRRAHRVAGFHRRAVARGFGGDAQRGREARQKSENHRAARAGGFGRGSFRAGGFRGRGGFDAAQSGYGIHAQPRALPIFEMGHAGVRHVQGRAAGNWHCSPSEFGISREGRARTRTEFFIPTRSSARIRTRR